MTSHRMFYLGLGCLISTVCWTVVMIAKEERNLSNFEVDRRRRIINLQLAG